MGVVTREVAERIPDQHLRAAAMAGADLNSFCSSCYGNDMKREVHHEKCTGDSGGWGKCKCACPQAKLLRGEGRS